MNHPASTTRLLSLFTLHVSLFTVAALAATPISPGNVFRAGATAALSIRNGDNTWCVLDAAAAPESEVVVASGSASGSILRIPHQTLGGKLGAYVLRSWQMGGSATNETRFAFIPPGDVRPAPWVGTQFHYRRDTWGGGDERLLPQPHRGTIHHHPGQPDSPVSGRDTTLARTAALRTRYLHRHRAR